jgi:copper transport protein
MLAGSAPASAHAQLISTDPGQSAVLATAPARVSLTFGESVEVAADGVRIFGPDGNQVDTGQATHLGPASTVGVGLRDGSRQGTYTVSWRVISADSHPVAGAFTFSIGHPSTSKKPSLAQPTGSAAVGVLYAIARALAYAALALLVGSTGFVLACLRGSPASRAVRRVMTTGWAGLTITSLACLFLQGPYGYGLGLSHLADSVVISETLASPLGAALQARFLLLAVAGAYLVLLSTWLPRLRPPGRWAFGSVGAALALGLTATWATADHASVGLHPAIALPVDVAHLTAMGSWLGGLVTLLVALGKPGNATDAAVAARRFSPIAAGSVLVLVATGSYQAWRQLGTWDAWLSTGYGRLLLVKVIVFAILLSVAALSRRWVARRRTADTSGLRRSVVAEAALGAVVLVLTALLVESEPGRTATAAPPGPTHRVVAYDAGGLGGTGRLEVDVDPATTGPNTIRVAIEDPTGKPHDIPEFHAALTLAARGLGPLTVDLRRTGVGAYAGTGVQIPSSGLWELYLTVRTSDIDEAIVAAPIDVR